jgi:6-pyruvoyltetrahydropterin/6-carboxytetrahydropterin synthase
MYTIAKTFAFSASHIIGGLPPEHPCGRLHGHNYEVEVILQAAALDGVGFVRDYRELSALKEFLDATLDHNHLNDVLGHDKTTAEAPGQVALRLVQNALAGSRCGACL